MRKVVRSLSLLAPLACCLAVSLHAQPLVFIDVPGPTSGPVLGLTTFSGWALDQTNPVSQVTILLDGAPIAYPALTISRPDVCAVYTSPNCPIVGWSFTLDTTLYSSGSHLLEARVTSTAGASATVTASFTIDNWTAGTDEAIHIGIDIPGNSTSTSFTGIAAFGGWAFSGVTTISNVSLSIDGVPLENANYGGSRPDVCAAFGLHLSSDCPVGWNAPVNTYLLADGTHTLDVTATSSTGQSFTNSTTFTVANFTNTNPLIIDIDVPNSNSGALSGTAAAIGGWAVDTTSKTTNDITRVQVSVDGVSRGNAVYGASRLDVCVMLGLTYDSNCPVGWNFDLDTTRLANGTHTLDVTAYTSSSLIGTMSTSFKIDNSSNTSNPTHTFIDHPNSATDTVVGGSVFSGWSININEPISYVQLSIDGAPIGNAHYGLSRPDVCAAFGNPPNSNCPFVGWSFLYDTTRLTGGTHTLTAVGVSASGVAEATSVTFTVANWTTSGNPIIVSIDTPNSSSGNLSGNMVAIGGWAIDLSDSISQVVISVDGIRMGTAVYGGSRPDVCAQFGLNLSSDCPVGWNFVLDTTVLGDGTHTLEVTATSAGGQSYTTTATFTVANLTSSNPIHVDIDVPNSSTGPITGTYHIGGWALASNDTISNVWVYVDGWLAGTAFYGGNRPDVCASFGINLPSCPVGWDFDLDTTLYESSNHTLNVVAQTSMGAYATQTTTFTVGVQ